jgi:glycosyltransferase involved in cell wall biosynthesis
VDQVWNAGLVPELQRARPDVLFVGGYGTLSTARAIGWGARARVPWVLYSESWGTGRGSAPKRWIKRAALPPVLSRAAGFVTYGRRGEEYLRHYGARGPVVVIGSNRDLVSISEVADRVRSRQARDERVFLLVGRLVEAKGVDVLLRAFEMASPELPGWVLKIAGDGPLREALEASSGRLPIRVLGPVPFRRIPEELAAADVLVLPSRHEPWGQVVPEAMAAGMPVLSSDAVGAADHFLESGRTGWIVPAGDPSALARGLRTAAGADLAAMGAAARERALKEDVREAARRVGDLLSRAGRLGWT